MKLSTVNLAYPIINYSLNISHFNSSIFLNDAVRIQFEINSDLV